MSKLSYAVSTLTGTIIGAGILALPYVIAKSGFVVGTINLIVIGILTLMLNLYFGEVVLRTEGKHQLTGYAERYLGKWGKTLMILSITVLIYGALIAYIIGEGESLANLFGGNPIFYSVVFFVLASAFVYSGVKAISRSELILAYIKIVAFATLFISLLPSVRLANLVTTSANYLYPFGVILFAYSGTAAIPEIKEVLAKKESLMKKSIIYGSVLPIVFYFLFSFAFVGALGSRNTEIATTAMGLFGNAYLILGNLFAVITIATPFLALGLALQEAYQYDYKLSKPNAFLLACVAPFLIFLFGARSFTSILSITGTLGGVITSILIVLMYWEAKKKFTRIPEYSMSKSKVLGVILILLFVIGALLELFVF